VEEDQIDQMVATTRHAIDEAAAALK